MVGQYASGYDNYIVLNSLSKTYTNIKTKETSRRLIELSLKNGSVFENDRKISKYMNFVRSKCPFSGSLKSIRKEYNIQTQLLKWEIGHDLYTLSNYEERENL